MARRIVWSSRAQSDRVKIFTYWNNRNKSKVYSRKLNRLYSEAAELLALKPNTGRPTNRADIRVKFVNHYAMIYKVEVQEIQILSIFDTRQSPKKLDQIIGR
jgi:toxin YoeB